MRKIILLWTLVLPLLYSCHNKSAQQREENGAFAKAKKTDAGDNLTRIAESGELIIGTISGPDTYFDYQGRGLGLQYALAEDFANTQGVGVRVELAKDSLELANMLKNGDIDVVAYQLSEQFCKKEGLLEAGSNNKKKHTTWAVRSNASDLAEALNDWYGEGVEIKAEKTERTWIKNRSVVHRKVRAPFISREKGIISTYDEYFKIAARYTGWDWKLIAAQCYQESGFDPNAISWAGAAGLMQLMPATAAQFGLSRDKIFSPTDNIATASKVIRHLQSQFSNISDAEERVKFVLASYNGGIGHIRDAQALARKHGYDANKWEYVGLFVRNLSNAQYYRDPVVKYGYMIGNETYGYVQSIMERWRAYGGNVHNLGAGTNAISDQSFSAKSGSSRRDGFTPHKKNRYSTQQKILSPEELRNAE